MSERNYSDDAETNDGRVIVWGLQDIKESLDSLVEQQRVGNMIAVMASAARGVADQTYSVQDYMEMFNRLNPQVIKSLGLNEGGTDD